MAKKRYKTTVWVELKLFNNRGGEPVSMTSSFTVDVLPKTAVNFRRMRAILAAKIRGIRDDTAQRSGARNKLVGWEGPILIVHKDGDYLVMPRNPRAPKKPPTKTRVVLDPIVINANDLRRLELRNEPDR